MVDINRLARGLRVCFTLNLLIAGSYVLGQPLVLEEIIVTSQLREQTLKDVPISVNVVSGTKLEEGGLERLEEIQAYVPNLTMSETGVGNNIYIRGIGSGINPGFEQSVAMFVDGVHYGRGQLYRAPLFDMERVEVLRGPQSTLFGKNSIAGAISLETRRPTQDFEGRISALYEPSHGERELNLVLSGPLSDALAGRFSYRSRDMDGYLENVTLNQDEPGRDEETVRLSLSWDPLDDVAVDLKFEKNAFDVTGRQVEILDDVPGTGAGAFPLGYFGLLAVPAGVPLQLAPDGTTVVLSGFGQNPSILDTTQDYERTSNGDFSRNDSQNYTMSVVSNQSDVEVTSITSFLKYDFFELCDCDFSGARGFDVFLEEDYKQFSQEFRLRSTTDSGIDWIAGVHFQSSELTTLDRIALPPDTFLDQAATALAYSQIAAQVVPAYLALVPGVFPDAGAAMAAAFADSLNGNPMFGVTGAAQLGGALPNTGANRTLSQDSKAAAIFGQLNFDLAQDWRISLSARYSQDKKDAERQMSLTDFDGGAFSGGPMQQQLALLAYSLFRVQLIQHQIDGSRTDRNLDWAANLQYDMSADTMMYGSVSTGFKAGGFDGRSNAVPDLRADGTDARNPLNTTGPGAFEFENESALTFEFGAKQRLMDGTAELNLAVFRTNYEDLQVSVFDGVLGFSVGNAAEAVVWGVELDGRWAVTENFMLSGSVGTLDFEFQDFPNGECYVGQTPDAVVGGVSFCDYAGQTNQYVADWSGFIAGDYVLPLSRDMQLNLGLDLAFTDEYFTSQKNDPATVQDAYAKVNARLAIANVDDRWQVALIGRNLTNKTVVPYTNNTPLSDRIAGANSHYGFVERPRSIAIQGIWNF